MKFRKRIKIMPGLSINLSKSGASVTAGVKGLSINSGKKGTYLNMGIPGTGLYDRKKISGKNVTTNNRTEYAYKPFYGAEEWTKKHSIIIRFYWTILAGFVFIFFNGYIGSILLIIGVVGVVQSKKKVVEQSLKKILIARKQYINGDLAYIETLKDANRLFQNPILEEEIINSAYSMDDISTIDEYVKGENEYSILDNQRNGDFYFRNGNYDKAVEFYLKEMKENENISTFSNICKIAEIYFERGEFKESLDTYNSVKGSIYGKYDRFLWIGIVKNMFSMNLYEGCIGLLQKDASILSDTSFSALYIGKSFGELGNSKGMITTFLDYLGKKKNYDNNMIEMGYLLGVYYLSNKDLKNAKIWIDKVYIKNVEYRDIKELWNKIN